MSKTPPVTRDYPSSIDRLPAELRELIGKLRREGRTINEIHAKLAELEADVSRSAVARHVKSLAHVQQRMRESREVANALVSQLGKEPDNKLAQANIELMHSVVMQTLTAAEEDEDGNLKPVVFDPKEAMFLASALSSLSSAAKTNDDRIRKARDDERAESAKKAGNAAKAKGLGKETVDFITAAVLGTA